MRFFKSMDAVRDARDLSPRVAGCLRKVVANLEKCLSSPERPWTPDDDGFAVLVEPTDSHADWERQFGAPPDRIGLECVTYDREHGCFVAIWAANNQFVQSLIVPDEPWLDPAGRLHLLDNMYEEQTRTVPPAPRSSHNSRSPARRR